MLQWFTPYPSTKSSSVFIPLFPLQMFLISKKTKQLYLQMNLLQVLFSYLQSFLEVWKMRMIYDKQPRVCWFFMNFPSDVDDLLVVKPRNWQAFPYHTFLRLWPKFGKGIPTGRVTISCWSVICLTLVF